MESVSWILVGVASVPVGLGALWLAEKILDAWDHHGPKGAA